MSDVLPVAHAHGGKVSLHYHGTSINFVSVNHAAHAFGELGDAVQRAKAQLSDAAVNGPAPEPPAKKNARKRAAKK